MATVANLIVKVGADNKQLKSGLKNSLSRIKNFAKSAAKALAKITTVVGVAVTAAAGLITAALNKTANQIDDLAKTSEKLGVGVAELQKLQFQAKLTGVSTDTLNMALQRMVRRVAEANKGTGEAVGALEELGINAAELNALAPDKQFQRIADAMKNVKSQSDRVRLSMKLFDSEGVALVNTLNSSLETSGKQFDALGVSITKTQAKTVEAFNDSKTTLDTIWQGFKQQLTVAIVPAFQLVVKELIDFTKRMGGMREVARGAAQGIVGAMRFVFRAVNFVQEAVDTLLSSFIRLEIAVRKLGAIREAATGRVSELLGGPAADQSESIARIRQLEDQLNARFKQSGDRASFFDRIDTQLAGVQGTIAGTTGAPQTAPVNVEVTIKSDVDQTAEVMIQNQRVQAAIEKIQADSTKKAAREVVR